MSEKDRRKEIRPADPFGHIMKSMNDFFAERSSQRGILEHIDEFFGNPRRMGGFTVELEENDEEYIVKALLPGVKKEQIDIEMLENQLLIHVSYSESEEMANRKTGTYSKKETMKKTSRLIPFHKPVMSKSIKASYENGLLRITVPKKRGRKIEL